MSIYLGHQSDCENYSPIGIYGRDFDRINLESADTILVYNNVIILWFEPENFNFAPKIVNCQFCKEQIFRKLESSKKVINFNQIDELKKRVENLEKLIDVLGAKQRWITRN